MSVFWKRLFPFQSSKNRGAQDAVTNDELELSSKQLSAVQSAAKSASESYTKLLSSGSKSSKLPKPKKKGINWSIKKIESARLQRCMC